MIEQYLERLFTWESLENTPRGVEFELKNRLTDATFNGITAAKLDGDRVAVSDITLEFEDGSTIRADRITEDDPLVFDLADVVQVIVDHERLRLGVHELEIGMDVEGFGPASFSTDDEVTEDDLVDVDPADYTVAELREFVPEITEPKALERLLERERDGKDRKTAKAAIEDRLEGVDVPDRRERRTAGSGGSSPLLGGNLSDLLVDVLETPKHVTVYAATQAAGGGTAAEIAGKTLLTEEAVEGTLEDLVLDGAVERTDDGYRARPPLSVLRSRSMSMLDVLSPTGN